MKKIFKGVAALALSLGLFTGVANAATASKSIDRNACETVYTNYYFFLDASTSGHLTSAPLSTFTHSTVAEYLNNSYQISNFSGSNIGYGQVAVSPNTYTSADGITSMSLDDYYTLMFRANQTKGSFSSGTKNYIVSHEWFEVNPDGSETFQPDSLSTNGVTVQAMKNATVNANSTLTLRSAVNPGYANPFRIQIDRAYYGSVTGKPVALNGLQWYFHPAVYYVQYCAPKTSKPDPAPVETYYHVYYRSRTTDVVTNMPADSTHNTKNNMNISSNVPYRQGYTFLGWTTDISSPVANSAFAPNSLYTDRKDLTLYAVWQKNEEQKPTPQPPIDNPQTGVTDYLLPFGGVAGISGAALTILKKKKGFKQF